MADPFFIAYIADSVDESIKDTLQDLAVYSIVAICILREEVSGVRKRDTNSA